MLLIAPAGSSGLSASVPLPHLRGWLGAFALALLPYGLAILWLDLPEGGLLALLFASGLMPAAASFAKARIGGHTGDILGACQQLAEMALLLALSPPGIGGVRSDPRL